MKHFNDKVVLVSGSSRGIGKATAIEFARQGAKVVLNGRDPRQLDKTAQELLKNGAVVRAFQGDVSNSKSASALIEQTIRHFGKIDILINNAGISMRGPFSTLNPEVYRSVFESNVIGVTNLTIPALSFIRESRGSIVFISSVAGIRGLPGLSAYCASKMALRAIAESIRIEESGSGIHVGLIQVGQTEIEPDKQTMAADGSLVTINDRSGFRVATKESVARAIAMNVRQREFITTLTRIGKLNAILQRIAPNVVEKILISHKDQILKRS